MINLQQTIKSFIRPGEQSGYVAECLKISVVTQGETLDKVVRNLTEAVSLHLEGEDPAEFGLIAIPSILVTNKIELHQKNIFTKKISLKNIKSLWLF